MTVTQLAPNLYLLGRAVNTGLLRMGKKAILFDCCDTITPEYTTDLGIQSIETILCTQHRRSNVSGAYRFVEEGAALVVPETERHLFEDVETYWNDWANRWHVYHNQPGPQVLTRPIPVARTVHEGDVIEWEGYTIHVLDTPGATDGSVSYVVNVDGTTYCFCGDTMYSEGKLWDFYSLQKGFGGVGDYHGFIGNSRKLISSLKKIGACGADVLIPSHGETTQVPKGATEAACHSLDALWRSHAAISSMNHYFPDLLTDTKDDPSRMKPAQTFEPPPFVQPVAFTSLAVVSETGAALLIDCGHDSVADTLQRWMQEGKIESVDACWVTHYHDDHADALQRVVNQFHCPIITDRHIAEILEHPLRFFLPCISPNGAPVARWTGDGETWEWNEFRLTAYHFPGQTFYHSGLLVEGRGTKVFFAGDSGSPTGIDDHCCGNRNFLGKGKGFRRCIEIWRGCKPEYIFNQHQPRAFHFSDAELDMMDAVLEERERLVAEMVPWDHPNFALDEWWVRTYPFEQETVNGTTVAVDIQFTNHGPVEKIAEVEPVLPEGWFWEQNRSSASVLVPANTDGATYSWCANPDRAVRVWLRIPEEALPGRYAIPFRITWDGRYLGQFRHAIIVLR